MSLNTDSPQDDEINNLLDNMFDDIMRRRLELPALYEKKSDQVDSKLEVIENIERTFYGILKLHSAYLKNKKASGRGASDHSESLLAKIREVVSNLGNIVSTVPKQ